MLPEVDRRIGPLTRRWSHMGIGVVVAIVVVLTVFFAIRLRKTYANEVEIALLRQEVETLKKDHETLKSERRAEMDAVLHTLYDNMSELQVAKNKIEKIPARRPSSVEVYVQNRFVDMDKRVTALERWRLSITR